LLVPLILQRRRSSCAVRHRRRRRRRGSQGLGFWGSRASPLRCLFLFFLFLVLCFHSGKNSTCLLEDTRVSCAGQVIWIKQA
jgi:hypothetical protein